VALNRLATPTGALHLVMPSWQQALFANLPKYHKISRMLVIRSGTCNSAWS